MASVSSDVSQENPLLTTILCTPPPIRSFRNHHSLIS